MSTAIADTIIEQLSCRRQARRDERGERRGDMSHVHQTKSTKTIPYTDGATDQRAAGCITDIETCACGAVRRVHVNGRHVDAEAWDLPEWVVAENPLARAYRPADARRLLVALARSSAGRAALEAAGYGAIVDAPGGGSDASTLAVVRAVWPRVMPAGSWRLLSETAS